MSLKIHSVSSDEKGHARVSGILDGDPFSLMCQGAKWVMTSLDKSVGELDADRPDCVREAKSAVWPILAKFRESNRKEFSFSA